MTVMGSGGDGGGASTLEVARALNRCVLARDTEGIRDVYAPGASVWQNFVDHERTVDEVAAGVDLIHEVVSDLSYGGITVHVTPTGYVEQHSLEGTVTDTGARFSHPVCLVVTVEAGRISRIEEYGDKRTIEPVAQAIARRNSSGSPDNAGADPRTSAALDPDLARREIETLLVHYARNLDANAPEEMRDIFAPDCVVRYPGMDALEGIDAVIALLREAHAPLAATCHSLSNVQIVVHDGGTASASCYVDAWHEFHADGAEYQLLGRYDDELVRTNQGWRIAQRRLSVFKTDFDAALNASDKVERSN